MANKTNTKKNGKLKQAVGILIAVLVVSGILFGILMLTKCGKDEDTHTAKPDKNEGVVSDTVHVSKDEDEEEDDSSKKDPNNTPSDESGDGETDESDKNMVPVNIPKAIIDQETGIRYVICQKGICAEGIFKEDGPYMTMAVAPSAGDEVSTDDVSVENSQEIALNFYPIKAQTKEEFVALEVVDGHYVFRADTIPELTIDEFDPVAAGIYMGKLYVDHFYYSGVTEGISAEDGTPYVIMIKDALMGEEATEPEAWSDTAYSFRLYSATYKGLYYTVDYKVAADGTSYLYDGVYGRLYLAPEALVKRILG